MSAFVNCETKPLRKSRLGPPDVYPQEAKQKEDELSFVNVKQGFNVAPVTGDEYGSARSQQISLSRVAGCFTSVLSKKYEINTMPDTGKKRQQASHKDNYWPVPTRPKAAELWLKDLVNNRPLSVLVKKVPIFNKREEILVKLCDYTVPMLRACWLIKMSSAYYMAISETKNKSKRQLPDQTHEWTQTVQRFLREQLARLEDYYSWAPQSAGYTTTLSGGYSEEQKVAARQWQYTVQLASVMYDEGLLDCELFLEWIMDTFRCRPYDDGTLRLLVPLLVQYANEFTHSELLSRKLAHCICKKLNSMMAEAEMLEVGSGEGGSVTSSRLPGHADTLISVFVRLVHCGFWRDLVYGLSCTLQTIVINCSTALVWNNVNDGRPSALTSSPLVGSPLDLLPCSPSQLPLPAGASNAEWRQRLVQAEADIVERSVACEARWSVQSATELGVTRVLAVLDALDQYKWNRVDDVNNLDTLYSRSLRPLLLADTAIGSGQVIVQLLCEWAVTAQRLGEHRALAVALLLEKWQAEAPASVPASGSEAGGAEGEDQGAASSGAGVTGANASASGGAAVYMFQDVLFRFLDTTAPLPDSSVANNPVGGASVASSSSSTSSTSPASSSAVSCSSTFSNLVLLFLELTRHDVFSHDHYLRTLISRGELRTDPSGAAQSWQCPGVSDRASSTSAATRTEPPDERLDIDDDLDKLVQHIKSTNADMHGADSPRDGFLLAESSAAAAAPRITAAEQQQQARQNRHLIFTTHFPLPQDDTFTDDDKQRHILLFGVRKARDDARHTVKKMSKEVMKLFSKKFSLDMADGGRPKRQCRGEFAFESVVARFQQLSFYDQHLVTHQCAVQVVEMLSSFSSGSSNYLPVVEHISFLFDLMELSMNIQELLESCLHMLRELPAVDSQLHQKGWSRDGQYSTSLALYMVGAFRRYHNTLIMCQEQTVTVFEGLYRVVKHVRNHTDCSSAERCILAYLVHVYSCCHYLRSKYYEARFESFSNAYPKLRQLFNTSLKPSGGANFARNAAFMSEYLANPGRALEASVVRALNDSAANRYSLVCNLVLEVCHTSSGDRLGDLAILAAEATARCNVLAAEWLSVLDAICAGAGSADWSDVLGALDVTAPSVHRSVALLITVLAARHCIHIDDVIEFGAHCLMITCSTGDRQREPGARLVLRVLGHLWICSERPQPGWYDVAPPAAPAAGQPATLKYSCDRHLLLAAQDNIMVPALLCALKAVVILADTTIGDGAVGAVGDRAESKSDGGGGGMSATPELSISAILGTSDHQAGDGDLHSSRAGTAGISHKAGLSEFARYMLKQICGQPCVREKILCSPGEVVSMERLGAPECDDGVDLLERVLTHKQARRLFHMIVHPNDHAFYLDDTLDDRKMCARILETVDQWSMRVALLDLRLLYRQTAKVSVDRHNTWLATLSRAIVDLFLPTDSATTTGAREPAGAPVSGSSSGSGSRGSSDDRLTHLWLIPSLVVKLPAEVQCRILQASTHALETSSCLMKQQSSSRSSSSSISSSSSVTAASCHQPFRQLVLGCVRGQEEQREELINSLQTQFQQMLCKESKDSDKDKEEKRKTGDSTKKESAIFPDEHKVGWHVYNALQLRFSLLGGVFDSIQHGNLTSLDAWILLLSQLVTHGVVTLYNNSDMYCIVLDMIATLIHSAVVGDTQSERPEENKRHFYTLGKKLRKELGDRRGVSAHYLRQFLPIPKKMIEVINTELKSAPLPGFESFEKRRGLILVDKQKVSPWDLLEGHRNPAPLSWSWFGAVKLERTPSRFIETLRKLRFHEHHMFIKPDQYFLEAPPLPHEEFQPIAEVKIVKEEPKPVEVVTCDSPRGAKRPRINARKKRGSRAANTSTIAAPRMGTPPIQRMPSMPYQQQTYPADQTGQQWGFPPHQQQPHQSQRAQAPPVSVAGASYYNGPQSTAGGSGFQQVGGGPSSKEALSMLINKRRTYIHQNMGGFGPGMQIPDKLRHQMMRAQHQQPTPAQHQHHQQQQMAPTAALYGQQAPGPVGSAGPVMQQQQQQPPAQTAMFGSAGYPPSYMSQQQAQQQQQQSQQQQHQQAGAMMAGVSGYGPQAGQAPAALMSGQQSAAGAQQAMMMRPVQQAGYMGQMRAPVGYMSSTPGMQQVPGSAAAAGQYRAMHQQQSQQQQQRMRHPMMMQQPGMAMAQIARPAGQAQLTQQQQQQQQQHNPYQFHH